MNITIDKKPNCEAVLHVELDAARVSQHRKELVQRYQSLAKVPGFRPGKAPAGVIEKRFAKELDSELRETLVGEGCREAAKEHKLAVISVNDVRDDTFHPDGNFSFSADLVLEPDFQLPEYKGIKVVAAKAEVTDELLAARKLEVQRQLASHNDVADRPLAGGDIAIINYSGSLEGTKLAEAVPDAPHQITGTEGYWVRMEEDKFLPGFVDQISGMSIGDAKEVRVNFPGDFGFEALAGREVVYQVELKGIKETVLPEWNESLAERLLPGKTPDELLEILRGRLQDELLQQRRSEIVRQIIEFLDKSTDSELPGDVIKRETQRRVDRMVEQGLRYGLENEDIEARQEEIFATATEEARTSVKSTLLLEQIARKENISVPDNELIYHIDAMARKANKPLKKFVQELKRQNAIPAIRSQVLVMKAVDFLVLNAEVSEETPAEAASTAEAEA